MIYTHLARTAGAGVTSPLDLLNDVTDEAVRAAVNASCPSVPIQLASCSPPADDVAWHGKGERAKGIH
jgi:hypothetical protein